MHTSHTILVIIPMCIFKFAFKRMITSFNLLFCVIKTHIVDLIEFVLINIRLNIFICFLLITYVLIFTQENSTHCTVNNSIILLLPVKLFRWYDIVPGVLGRYNFNILRTKSSQ